MRRIFNFYLDGFKGLSSLGKTLWIIIFIKLIIMFVLLKLFFFPNYLSTHFRTNQERSNHVIETLIKQQK